MWYLEISKNFNCDPLEIDNAERHILVTRTSKSFFEGKETTSILILSSRSPWPFKLGRLFDKKGEKVETVLVVVEYIEEEWNFPPGAGPKAF